MPWHLLILSVFPLCTKTLLDDACTNSKLSPPLSFSAQARLWLGFLSLPLHVPIQIFLDSTSNSLPESLQLVPTPLLPLVAARNTLSCLIIVFSLWFTLQKFPLLELDPGWSLGLEIPCRTSSWVAETQWCWVITRHLPGSLAGSWSLALGLSFELQYSDVGCRHLNC